MILMIATMLAAAPVGPVRVEAHPARPFAEQTGSGVDVDGDLMVFNDGDTPLGIDEIAVEVRDPPGRLVQRKEWNSNGTAPSIRMLNAQKVPAHGRVLLFNPFAHFPADVAVGRLDFTLALSREGVDERIEARTSVTPRPDRGRLFGFPLRGRVLVWDGHDFASHHRRWDTTHPVLAEAGFATTAARYSLDLILVDEAGRRSRGDEKVNSNWLSWGAPVRAVAPGRIVAVRNDQVDDRNFDVGTVKIPNAMYGNYVVLAHSDGSFSMYGHLQQGSTPQRVGAQVAAHAVLGKIGASGSALFPHLHFQRMDGPTDRSEGIPTRFGGVARPDGKSVAGGFVDSGDVLTAR
jgi:hypothetical protein